MTTKTRQRGKNLLTDGKIRAAKAKDKPYKLSDGEGLVLVVTPNGDRLWRLRFTHPTKFRAPTEREKARAAATGKTAKNRHVESMVSLGSYPATGLAEARTKADAARKLIEAKESPADAKRAEREGDSFEAMALKWLALQQPVLAENTLERAEQVFRVWVFPRFGGQPVAAVTEKDVTRLIADIGDKGHHETARRAFQRIASVLRFAKARHAVAVNVAAEIRLRDLLGPGTPQKHHAAITDPARIGELLRAIDGYQGAAVTRYALQLAALVFTRPGERRRAEWTEFDLDSPTPTWTIPAGKMKMRQHHIVPLSRQAVAILRELHKLTGTGRYLFPAMTGPSRPMSENTENTAIRRLGYTNTEMTAHGFRSMASTCLNTGWPGHQFNRDHIERQLAHNEADSVRAAYNSAEHLPERRAMMQAWADYLDTLRATPAKAAA